MERETHCVNATATKIGAKKVKLLASKRGPSNRTQDKFVECAYTATKLNYPIDSGPGKAGTAETAETFNPNLSPEKPFHAQMRNLQFNFKNCG